MLPAFTAHHCSHNNTAREENRDTWISTAHHLLLLLLLLLNVLLLLLLLLLLNLLIFLLLQRLLFILLLLLLQPSCFSCLSLSSFLLLIPRDLLLLLLNLLLGGSRGFPPAGGRSDPQTDPQREHCNVFWHLQRIQNYRTNCEAAGETWAGPGQEVSVHLPPPLHLSLLLSSCSSPSSRCSPSSYPSSSSSPLPLFASSSSPCSSFSFMLGLLLLVPPGDIKPPVSSHEEPEPGLTPEGHMAQRSQTLIRWRIYRPDIKIWFLLLVTGVVVLVCCHYTATQQHSLLRHHKTKNTLIS